ncbi:MAG TPA: hopanoid-associated sugar epimerase [Candidatus Binataceae bacterium]
MAERTALVTGGNGFVGCHVVRALVARGDRVRVLAREGADLTVLKEVDCEMVRGDLRDRDSVQRAVSGCSEIYHVAADYRLWVLDEEPMYQTNITGTRNILEAAGKAGVNRIVHTSTVGTLGVPKAGVGREDTPVTLDDMPGPYKRSKFLSERDALAAASDGLPVVVVNPSTPVGPLDHKPTPTGRVIVDFLNHRMPAYLDTGLNLVGVEDCARGHLLAAERGRIGEKYILGGENLTLKEMLDRLATLSGLRAPRFKVPYRLAYAFALGGEFVARNFTKTPPRASLTEVRMASKKMFFDSSKARAELGFDPRPIDEALRAAIDYYRSNGFAPAA